MTALTITIRSFLPLDEQGMAIETLLRKVFLHARNATQQQVRLALAVLRSQDQILLPVETDFVRYNPDDDCNLYKEKKRLLAIVETPHTLVQILNSFAVNQHPMVKEALEELVTGKFLVRQQTEAGITYALAPEPTPAAKALQLVREDVEFRMRMVTSEIHDAMHGLDSLHIGSEIAEQLHEPGTGAPYLNAETIKNDVLPLYADHCHKLDMQIAKLALRAKETLHQLQHTLKTLSEPKASLSSETSFLEVVQSILGEHAQVL